MTKFTTLFVASALTFAVFPAMADGIKVKLTVDEQLDQSLIEAIGSTSHVITEDEIEAFGLDEDTLKNMVLFYNVLNVKDDAPVPPNDAFLKGPTPWNDLYSTYNWDQVSVVWKPISAEIIKAESTPFVIATEPFSNNETNETITVSGTLSQSLTSGIEWSWQESKSTSSSVSVGVEVEVGLLGKGGKVNVQGETTIASDFGKGGSETLTKAVASTASMQQQLKPGKSVEFIMTASQGNLEARVVYEQSLTGYIAVNYNPTYNGHHFYALPVQSVLDAHERMTNLNVFKPEQVTQIFAIDHYTNVASRAVAP